MFPFKTSNYTTRIFTNKANGGLIFNYVIFISFTVLSLWLIYIHEPWRDEAQSWLLVRDTGFLELLAQLRYEGHPFLWYIICRPFAKLGFPYITQAILHLPFVLGIAAIICFNSSLKSVFNALVLAGTSMFYTTNAFARTYAPSIFFIMLIYLIYDKRFKEYYVVYALSLFCMINLNLFGMIAACSFFGADVILTLYSTVTTNNTKLLTEKKFVLVGAAFFVGILLFALFILTDVFSPFLVVRKRTDINTFYTNISTFQFSLREAISAFKIVVSQHAFRIDIILKMLFGWEDLPLLFYVAYFILYAGLPVTIAAKNKKLLILIILSINFALTIAFLMVTPHFNYAERYASVSMFVMVVLYFIAFKNPISLKKKICIIIPIAILVIAMAVSILFGLYMIIYDTKFSYSGSQNAAQAIIDSGYDTEDTLIVAASVPYTSSVLPYLENVRTILYPEGFRSFACWQELPPESEFEYNLDYVRMAELEMQKNPIYKDCLVILLKGEEETIELYNMENHKLIFEEQEPFYDAKEGYVIYKIR